MLHSNFEPKFHAVCCKFGVAFYLYSEENILNGVGGWGGVGWGGGITGQLNNNMCSGAIKDHQLHRTKKSIKQPNRHTHFFVAMTALNAT